MTDPFWLREARVALEWARRLALSTSIEAHAFESMSPTAQRDAYRLLKHIEGVSWPDDAKQRAGRLAPQLLQLVEPVAFMVSSTRAEDRELEALGLSRVRVATLTRMKRGPYDVVLAGMADNCGQRAICERLGELGYTATEIQLLLERVAHIAPEPIAHLLHQSVAVRIKVALEAAGAKVRIKAAK